MFESRKYLIFPGLALESRLTNLLLHHIPLASNWETGIFPDLFRFCPAFTCSPIFNPKVSGARSPALVPALSVRLSHHLFSAPEWSTGPQRTLAREVLAPAWLCGWHPDSPSFHGVGERKAWKDATSQELKPASPKTSFQQWNRRDNGAASTELGKKKKEFNNPVEGN